MSDEIGFDEFTPWLLIPIMLIGGFLRVLLLDMKGLWLDETFSIWLASQSTGNILHWVTRIDQHPPLYYLLLHHWIAVFGDAPYYVRLFSVLFGTATIPVMYLIGKRISGSMVGVVAAVFLAVSPFHIYYAQEARMYTLLAFNVSVAMYALVRLLTDPAATKPIGRQFREYLRVWRSAQPLASEPAGEFSYQNEPSGHTGWQAKLFQRRLPPLQSVATDLTWVLLIVFTALAMYSHNTAVLFPFAANIFVFGLMLYQKTKKSAGQRAFYAPALASWIASQAVILLLWAPWIFSFLRQAGAVVQRFWIPKPTPETVIYVLRSFLNPSAPMPAGQAAAIWALYILALCLGMVYFRKNLSRLAFLGTLFAIPFLVELLVSLRRPIFSDRTLIWVTIPLFLLLAAGIIQLRFRFLMLLMVGIFGFLNLFSASDYFRFYQKEDWSTPAGYVSRFSENGDLLLFNSNFVVIPFNYYFRQYEEKYSIEVTKQGLPLDLFDSGVLEPEMTSEDIPALVSKLKEHNRVWLVYSHDSYTDPQGLIPQTLASQKKLIRTREFYGGRVQLYANP